MHAAERRQVTTFLVRSEEWAPFAEWRKAAYPLGVPRRCLPANTGVVVKELGAAELLLEVEAIAVDPAAPGRGRRKPAAGLRAGPRAKAVSPARTSVRARTARRVVVTVKYVFGLAVARMAATR